MNPSLLQRVQWYTFFAFIVLVPFIYIADAIDPVLIPRFLSLGVFLLLQISLLFILSFYFNENFEGSILNRLLSHNFEVNRISFNLLNISNTDYYISLYKYYSHYYDKNATLYYNQICIVDNNKVSYEDCYMIKEIFKKEKSEEKRKY
tara:strand:- start:4 stop:447 length:444 start_codon:yes stop_codon:yes gene_type:complete